MNNRDKGVRELNRNLRERTQRKIDRGCAESSFIVGKIWDPWTEG